MDNFGLLFAKSLGGGGGSGTDNYNELSSKPQINSVTLSGNKSLSNLGIQAELTFDDEPTEDSTNPVTSGGVYTALGTKQDTLTIDSAPTENSTNPVQSGGVYTALAGKEDTLTFDNAPTNNSDNPVKSGGIYTALGEKQDTVTFDGTYSASTNAAATVSTVTNAINALDVTGESGISASKTISAWSETDGKVSVSTQDIAIAGTQAVLTGYTPESPAQTDSILATDTVNAAIKKLDERSRIDENNISSLDIRNHVIAAQSTSNKTVIAITINSATNNRMRGNILVSMAFQDSSKAPSLLLVNFIEAGFGTQITWLAGSGGVIQAAQVSADSKTLYLTVNSNTYTSPTVFPLMREYPEFTFTYLDSIPT